MVRILLVEDQLQVRRGLRMSLALEADFTVIGEAEEGNTAMTLVSTLQPDVVVMDIEMAGIAAIALVEALCASEQGCTVIILSIHDDAGTQARMYAAGAAAFVSKRESPQKLIAAIRQMAHQSDPTDSGSALDRWQRGRSSAEPPG